jgi:serine/threonine protein phosphatase PrpC
MNRPRLYVETSVINGPFSKNTRIALASSAFWDKVKAAELEACISSYVLFELRKTVDDAKRDALFDIASRCVVNSPSGKKVEILANEYVRVGMIPRQYIFDAYHIASASLGGFEALVTWNFEHMLKQKTEQLLGIVNREKAIQVPRIRSPEEYVW